MRGINSFMNCIVHAKVHHDIFCFMSSRQTRKTGAHDRCHRWDPANKRAWVASAPPQLPIAQPVYSTKKETVFLSFLCVLLCFVSFSPLRLSKRDFFFFFFFAGSLRHPLRGALEIGCCHQRHLCTPLRQPRQILWIVIPLKLRASRFYLRANF